jgi:hypothetical protein
MTAQEFIRYQLFSHAANSTRPDEVLLDALRTPSPEIFSYKHLQMNRCVFESRPPLLRL